MPVLRIIAGPDGEDPYAVTMPLGDPARGGARACACCVASDSSTLPLRPVMRAAIDRRRGLLGDAGAEVERGVAAQPAAGRWRSSPRSRGVSSTWSRRGRRSTEPTRPTRARPPLRDRCAGGGAAAGRIGAAAVLRTRGARRLVDAARRASDELAATIGDGVLLYPPFPRLAPRHRTTFGQPWLATNTAVFNLFGMPATQVPLGIGRRGLPLGVQVVAAPGQ